MNIKFHLDKVFRETEDVTFYDISITNSNASDLVIHNTAATSPPDDKNGNKQFYVHYHQIDNNRVISGERTFELVNFEWEKPYQIVRLKREYGALTIPKGTFHRSVSGLSGSIGFSGTNSSAQDRKYRNGMYLIIVFILFYN